jgi:hypothetical protein
MLLDGQVGLDATIRSATGSSMGDSKVVESMLAAAFPGIRLKRSTYFRRQTFWEALGNYFPGAVERALNRSGVAGHFGDFEGEDFSAQFSFPVGDVQQVDVVLYPRTNRAGPKLEELARAHGWSIKYR